MYPKVIMQGKLNASVFVQYPRRLKAFNFDNFENSDNSFLWSDYFIDIFVKMDSMSRCDIRLVFTFPPKDSLLQYKKCVHLWNNFPCISTSMYPTWWMQLVSALMHFFPRTDWQNRNILFLFLYKDIFSTIHLSFFLLRCIKMI